MNKNLIIVIAIVVLLVGGFLIYSVSRQPQTGNQEINPAISSATPAGATPAKATSTGISSHPGTQSASKPLSPVTGAGTLKITMPVSGETWLLGKIHTVRWNAPAARPGEIVLLDAASKEVVGWVTPNLLASQVQYSWNTRSLTVSKTSSLGKDIVPGDYILRIIFNGMGQPLDSAPFSIISTGEERIVTQTVSIRNYIFSPSFITVKRGDQIAIVNEDMNSYTLQVNGITVLKLPQWNSYVFDAGARVPGSYAIQLKEQVSEKLTVVVE